MDDHHANGLAKRRIRDIQENHRAMMLLGGKVGRNFVRVLSAELTGVREGCWNVERLIVIQILILQCDQDVYDAKAIWRRRLLRLDT